MSHTPLPLPPPRRFRSHLRRERAVVIFVGVADPMPYKQFIIIHVARSRGVQAWISKRFHSGLLIMTSVFALHIKSCAAIGVAQVSPAISSVHWLLLPPIEVYGFSAFHHHDIRHHLTTCFVSALISISRIITNWHIGKADARSTSFVFLETLRKTDCPQIRF